MESVATIKITSVGLAAIPVGVGAQQATSLLMELEPIFGVSIALNLAFINIKKFQYIDVVKRTLASRIADIDQNIRTNIGQTPWFIQINDMASVETALNPLDNKRFKLWISAPAFWGILYNILFYWQVARAFSIAGTAYCIFLLLLGVGQQVGAISLWATRFTSDRIGGHYWAASLSLLWPIACIAAGSFICTKAISFMKYQTDNLGRSAVKDAGHALDDDAKRIRGASER